MTSIAAGTDYMPARSISRAVAQVDVDSHDKGRRSGALAPA